MSAGHDEGHEVWLAERLAERRAPAQWPEPYASCAQCRRAYEELAPTVARLERAAAEDRAVLESALRRPPDPPRARRGARGRLRLAASLALLAAAGWLLVPYLAGLFGGGRAAAPRGANGVRLAPEFELGVQHPPGGGLTFRWRYPVPPAGSFTVRVRDADGRVVAEIEGLTESRWTPPEPQRARIPERFTWEVLVLDATGEVIARARATHPPGAGNGDSGG